MPVVLVFEHLLLKYKLCITPYIFIALNVHINIVCLFRKACVLQFKYYKDNITNSYEANVQKSFLFNSNLKKC